MVIKTKVLPKVHLFNAYLNMLQLILNVLQVCNNNFHWYIAHYSHDFHFNLCTSSLEYLYGSYVLLKFDLSLFQTDLPMQECLDTLTNSFLKKEIEPPMIKGRNLHIRFLYCICPDESLTYLKGRFYQNLLLLVDVPPPLTVASIVIRIGLMMLFRSSIVSFFNCRPCLEMYSFL